MDAPTIAAFAGVVVTFVLGAGGWIISSRAKRAQFELEKAGESLKLIDQLQEERTYSDQKVRDISNDLTLLRAHYNDALAKIESQLTVSWEQAQRIREQTTRIRELEDQLNERPR